MCSYSFVNLTSGDFLGYDGKSEDAGEDTDADDDDVLDDGDVGQLVHLQFEVHHAGQDEGQEGTPHGSCTQQTLLQRDTSNCAQLRTSVSLENC